MRPTTIAKAKNVMRRAARELIDPVPSKRELEELWDHFADRCAYCDVQLERASRIAHLDHADADGGNGIGNRILACAHCNGDLKREQHWRAFLERQVSDESALKRRLARIEAWQTRHSTAPPQALDPAVQTALARIEQAIADYDKACLELRALARRASPTSP